MHMSMGILLHKKSSLDRDEIYLNARKVRTDSSMEQMMGIEPTLIAWKAIVLPLNYICTTRTRINNIKFSAFLQLKISMLDHID